MEAIRSDVAFTLDSDSILKVRSFMKDINFAMFSTITKGAGNNFSDLSIHSRPMCTQQVDFDGRTLWFFTRLHSPKISELNENVGIQSNWNTSGNNNVNVAYADPLHSIFVSFVGKATVLQRNDPIDKGFIDHSTIQSTTTTANPPRFNNNDFYTHYLNDEQKPHRLRPWNNYWDTVFVRRGMFAHELIPKLWHRGLDSWFTSGASDPEICLLRVDISGIEYWNAPNNRMVQLFSKMRHTVTPASQFEEKKILMQQPGMQQQPYQQQGYQQPQGMQQQPYQQQGYQQPGITQQQGYQQPGITQQPGFVEQPQGVKQVEQTFYQQPQQPQQPYQQRP